MILTSIEQLIEGASPRVAAGLPSAEELEVSEIPASTLRTFVEGSISDNDLMPNVVVRLHEYFPSTAQPPLDTLETIERHKILRGIASLLLINVMANEL